MATNSLTISASAQAPGISFPFDIYKSIINNRKSDENVFISPFSIFAALSMVNIGAQGPTRDEISAATGTTGALDQVNQMFQDLIGSLPAPSSNDSSPGGVMTFFANNFEPAVLKLANHIFAQTGLQVKPDFADTLLKFYKSALTTLDFKNNTTAAKQEVSKWVEDATGGKIKNMGDSLGKDTVMALISAIYFKAQWADSFEQSSTRNRDFFLSNGQNISVPFMSSTDQFKSSYAEFKDLDCKGLIRPYNGAPYSMVILLPNKKDGLADLEKKIQPSLFDHTNYRNQEIDVLLPKFKIEDKLDLQQELENIGMKTMFTSQANFRGITDSPPLMVSKVIHQTFISVDEKGTEAAAATMVEFIAGACLGCTEPPRMEFHADHPFLFAIVKQDSNTILFLGRVERPEF